MHQGPITIKDLNIGKPSGAEAVEPPEAMTPEEHIEYAHKEIRQNLAADPLVPEITFSAGAGASPLPRTSSQNECRLLWTIRLPELPKPNAQAQIEAFRAVLKSNLPDGLKSYDLPSLLHLVGDV